MIKLTNNYILLFILVIATILRFYLYLEVPLTHDEFSALFRTNYTSFSDLINLGVRPDGHPAGIQVFLFYWLKLVGLKSWLIKLPFTLAGIASVFFMFKIGKLWFNETVGIISSAFLCGMEIMVMYSHIARPYISGHLFVFLMVYFWSLIILKPREHSNRNALFYILSAALCAYNHHFSLLFVAILGLLGLFLIKRKWLWRYILSGLFIFTLYIPHLSILFAQLNIGGLEGWLAKPTPSYFVEYVRYLFNFSTPVYIVVSTIVGFGLSRMNSQSFNIRKFILFLILFILPFITGYLYSVYFSSVLQYSVLIFSSPFILFVLFGHISNQKVSTNAILVFVILSVCIYGLIVDRKYYSLFYTSPYEVILSDFEKVKAEFPNSIALVDSHQKINDYYVQTNSITLNYAWFGEFKSTKDFIEYLQFSSLKSDHLYFGTLPENPPNTVAIILDYYPNLVWQKNYLGATTYLFSTTDNSDVKKLNQVSLDIKFSSKWSNIELDNFLADTNSQKTNSYLVDRTPEWSVAFSDTLKNWNLASNDFIDVKLEAEFTDVPKDQLLVTTIIAHDSTAIYWGSSSWSDFELSDTFPQKITLYHSIKFSDIIGFDPSHTFKAFIWNKGFQEYKVQNFSISKRLGNPVLYGLVEEIE